MNSRAARAKHAFLTGAATALGIFAFALAASAADQSVPTNLPNVRAYPAPAAGFDPLTASDQQLDVMGYPPRPDSNSNPAGYASWLRAVTTQSERIVPELEPTDTYNRPLQIVGPAARQAPERSTNWSGYILANSAVTKYSTGSYRLVQGDFVVPWVLQPIGVCGGPVFASSWVGIDGTGRDTALIQAGFSGSSTCSKGKQTLSWQTWFEWFPLSEVVIKNFTTNPGDDYYVEVWSTSKTKAKAFIENFVENKTASITFTAPKNSILIGNSAEWIVEAPQVGGGQTSIGNYSADFFANALAEDFDKTVSGPGAPGRASSIETEIVNKAGDVVSVPILEGDASIYFTVTGPAR